MREALFFIFRQAVLDFRWLILVYNHFESKIGFDEAINSWEWRVLDLLILYRYASFSFLKYCENIMFLIINLLLFCVICLFFFHSFFSSARRVESDFSLTSLCTFVFFFFRLLLICCVWFIDAFWVSKTVADSFKWMHCMCFLRFSRRENLSSSYACRSRANRRTVSRKNFVFDASHART